MKRALLKTTLILGIPTLTGIIIGTFLEKVFLSGVFGFTVGLTIFVWVLIVKIRHLGRAIQQRYIRQPDNH